MNMTPRLRKFALLSHITFSVGWFGAVAPYLALAIAGLTSPDPQMVRAAYLSMELIGWFVLVPFSVAALLTGLVQSLGTPWGVFRHWWILTKFLLTIVAVIVLFNHMEAVSRISRMAAEATLDGAGFRALQIQLMVHPAGGLVVLLAAMTLSVFKPWGMTAYGKRKLSQADMPVRPRNDAPSIREPGLVASRPRWARAVWIHAIHAVALVLLFVVIQHLAGGGMRHH